MADELRAELKRLYGHDDFRPGQRPVVEAVMSGVDTLAILPTGGGKSLTYQLPAMLLPGATLVLSPLIALMKDQAENLPPEVAERTTVINSSLELGEVGRRMAGLRSGRYKMVYAAPERLRQPTFLHALRRAGVSLVVVDEAHCISQWGHDFRPDYRAVGQMVAQINPRTVLAVTATATPDVADDIEKQLGRPMKRLVNPTFRDNLFLSAVKVANEDEKLNATLEICRDTEGIGLVYATSREKCEQLSRMLARYGIKAGFYHAGLPPDERAAAQDRFMSGAIRVMAATVAFGMGVDKSDIRFLVHYHPSRALENYYQEAGRAGRDGQPSECILLHSTADATNARRRQKEDALNLETVRAVYQGVRQSLAAEGRKVAPVALEDLIAAAGGDESTLRASLPLLEEAGLLKRHGDVPRRMTVSPYWGERPDVEYTPEMLQIAEYVGEGGDFDPVILAESVKVPLYDLEATLLECQDAGLINYRSSAREPLFQLLPPPADAKDYLAALLNHRAEGQKSRVESMIAYAQENRCRHQQIARYFGDRWPLLRCSACDVCAGASPLRPTGKKATGTTQRRDTGEPAMPPALAALGIVADLTSGSRPFAVGKAGLVKILRGTPDAPVREGRTPGFGAMADAKKAEVERLVEALIEKNYLLRDDEDEYRRLWLTAGGREALQDGDCDVEWKMATRSKGVESSRSSAASEEEGEVDPYLLDALKQWRRERSTEDNVPPYVVFSDKVLISIATRKPANEFDLLDISGIGPAKAASYGDAVFEVIRKHGGGSSMY